MDLSLARVAPLAAALALVGLLGACQTDTTADEDPSGDAGVPTAAMTSCDFAGTGATAGVDGERINFTCGSVEEGQDVVLAGDIQLQDEGWMILQAQGSMGEDGFEASETSMVPVEGIVLADGTACLFAGTGATFAADGERANYTCGTNAEGQEVVLAGEVQMGEAGWTIDKAVVEAGDEGFETVSSEMAVIATLQVPAGG